MLPRSFNFGGLIGNITLCLNLLLCYYLPAVHEKIFVLFMVASLLYELLTLFVFKWAHPELGDKPHVGSVTLMQFYFFVVTKLLLILQPIVRIHYCIIIARMPSVL